MKKFKKVILPLFLLSTLWTKAQTIDIGTVTDIDGNIYRTVVIGKQIWMAENLKTTTYNNGIKILFVTSDSIWQNLNNGAYCWYHNTDSNATKYGALYNWYAVRSGNLCPAGWRVPTDENWIQLEGYIDTKYKANDAIWNTPMLRGYNAGKRLKSKFGWNSNGNGFDSFGFNALPAGERSGNKYFFRHIGNNAFWWCSTELDTSLSWYRCFVFFDDRIIRNTHPKTMGFSVRCVKDL
ncbi:MAG: FISUMP domain-containing protein [Bacteroidales bacterium]